MLLFRDLEKLSASLKVGYHLIHQKVFPRRAASACLVAVSLCFIQCSVVSPAKAGLSFCNRSALPITTAVGSYDEAGWFVSGWWKLWPNDCAMVLGGRLSNKNYYYYGKADNKLYEWSVDSDQRFCVTSNVMNQYRTQANCANTLPFGKIDIGDQALDDYPFSFSCPNCKLPNFKYNKDAGTVSVYHVIKTNFAGTDVYMTVDGRFQVTIDNGNNLINATASLDFDMSNFQRKLPGIAMQQVRMSDDCGDNFSINSVSVSPDQPSATLSANGHYERWLCTSADLPQITCEDTWIETKGLPTCETDCEDTWIEFLGVKTKGVPECTVSCEDTWIKTKGIPACTNHGMKTVRTSHNKLVEQGGSLSVSIAPSIFSGSSIRFTPVVTDVHVDGFAQTVVDFFKLDLKKIVQNILDSSIDESLLSVIAPDEFKNIVTLNSVNFYSGVGGSLRMSAAGTVKITGPEALKLCQQFWPQGKCFAIH